MFVCLFVTVCLFVCFRLPPWPVSGCDVCLFVCHCDCLFVSDCCCGQSLVVMFVCLFVTVCLFVCFRLLLWPVSGCDVCLFVCHCLFVCLFQIAAVASLWL